MLNVWPLHQGRLRILSSKPDRLDLHVECRPGSDSALKGKPCRCSIVCPIQLSNTALLQSAPALQAERGRWTAPWIQLHTTA